MNEITIDENLLTFVDDLIKVVELKLLQEQSAQEIAEKMLAKFIAPHLDKKLLMP